ncbi:MAG: DUF3634 family protein [Candidatus Udaeobacter sp.]
MKKVFRGFIRSFRSQLVDSLAGRAVNSAIDIGSRILTRPLFVIRFEGGVARLASGSIPAFLAECTDIATLFGIQTGKICGVETEGCLRLKFSETIPTQAQQRLRNLYLG